MNTNIPVLPSTEDSTATAPAPVAADRLDATHASITLNLEGQEMALHAPYKVFSSGSMGFFANGKMVMLGEDGLPDGRKYQLTFTVVRIGSNPNKK